MFHHIGGFVLPHDTLDLAALIASRLCHDLVSPVGAIDNGLELLELSGAAPQGPEMSLISASCQNARARLRFFRLAFGHAGAGQMVSAREAAEILHDWGEARLRCSWPAGVDAPRQEAQLVFLAALCLERALPRGGEIEIAASPGGWRLSCGAALPQGHAAWDWMAAYAEAPEAAPAQLQPAEVQFALLPVMAARRGLTLRLEHGPPGKIHLARD